MLRAITPKAIKSRVRDLVDSIRFMSKAERRRVYLGTAVVSSVTATGTYLSFHTVGTETVMQNLQMYRYKFGVPVSPQLYQLLEQTLAETTIDQDSSVGLFNFVGNELYSVGSLLLPTGAYIGLPFNLNFDDVSQLKVESIRLLGRYRTKRSTNAPVIKRLFEAMILSEQAKKYALAHELNWLASSYVFVKATNIFLCTLGSFLLAPVINQRLGFTSSKKRMPRILCGLMCFLTVTVFAGLILDQLLDEWYDIRALRRTLQTTAPSYQAGAVEYYSKLIERNKALYELLDEYGPRYYTEDGQTKRVFGLMKQNYETHLALATMSQQG